MVRLAPPLVQPGLYLGARAHAKDRGALRECLVKSVVNCTPPKSADPTAGCPNFFPNDLEYLRIPVFDNQAEDVLCHFELCSDFIQARLHYGGVLVHCNRGISRSVRPHRRANGFSGDVLGDVRLGVPHAVAAAPPRRRFNALPKSPARGHAQRRLCAPSFAKAEEPRGRGIRPRAEALAWAPAAWLPGTRRP
ncbi:protein-tyrosine phosphatase-like protein [Pelagophyceae sp. CCMP2097]|nr:protein-tyrosine phosphatase-like protein [Pelagophyceae sp. CCMP2097]